MMLRNRTRSFGSPATHSRAAGLVLVVLMLVLLVPLPPLAEGDSFGKNAQNLLHIPLFALVTLLLRFSQLSWPPHWRSLSLCFFVASLMAGFSETAQSITGRTPSLDDFAANFSGILLACTILLRGSGRWILILRLHFLFAGGGLLAFAARPLMAELSADRTKREMFPALIDQGHPNAHWEAQGATLLRLAGRSGPDGGSALEVRLAEGSFEGLRYDVPKGVTSAGYSGLMIDIFNPGRDFELGIRLDGGGRQRHYRSVTVPEGRSVSHVEWGSNLGDGKLLRVVLFTGEDLPARTFQLFDVRLVKEIPRTHQPGP